MQWTRSSKVMTTTRVVKMTLRQRNWREIGILSSVTMPVMSCKISYFIFPCICVPLPILSFPHVSAEVLVLCALISVFPRVHPCNPITSMFIPTFPYTNSRVSMFWCFQVHCDWFHRQEQRPNLPGLQETSLQQVSHMTIT